MTEVVLTRSNTTFTPAVGRFLWIISGFESISQIFSAKAYTDNIWASNSSVNTCNIIRLGGWERGLTKIPKAVKVQKKRKKRSVRDCEVWQRIYSWKTGLFPLYCCCLNNFKDRMCFSTPKIEQELKCAVSHWGHKRHGKEQYFWRSNHCSAASGQEAAGTLTKN